MIEQEKMLMREEQNSEQVNVCPTCYNIYNYLEEHYFEEKEEGKDQENQMKFFDYQNGLMTVKYETGVDSRKSSAMCEIKPIFPAHKNVDHQN
jgi:hypothetical protein